MYLHDLSIRNVGPISACDINPAFTDSGFPKPILIVGQNGSGKTIVLSAIVDAMILMASQAFEDVTPIIGLGKAYFRISGETNQRSGTQFSTTLIKFKNSDDFCEYIERTGNIGQLSETELSERFPKLIGQSNSTQPASKDISGFSKSSIENIFIKNSNLYFPATRLELPHWQNAQAFPVVEMKDGTNRYTGYLGKKQIITSQSLQENSSWILDVIMDSRIDFQIFNNQINFRTENLNDRVLFGQARKNVNSILQKILQDESATINVYYRGQGSRFYIEFSEGKLIPSLRHLSLGQSVLFNLFCTIIRSADLGDLNRGHQLHEIEGIVIIDEIESHLHENLRFEVLPSLIQLFPKVQFIISTHSPSFLLGMTRLFGEDGVGL